MNEKRYILFDLDGTIVDPGAGITKSVQYALSRYGIQAEDLKSLERFVGPPLHESFQKFYGFDQVQSVEAVAIYREYYGEQGIRECSLYEGIRECLKMLQDNQRMMVLATSKATFYAEKILADLEIAQHFSAVCGAEMDGRRSDKAEVIEYALRCAGAVNKQEAVMVGDKLHDIVGAKKNGIESIGVAYGYGGEHELWEAGADLIVNTAMQLMEVLL